MKTTDDHSSEWENLTEEVEQAARKLGNTWKGFNPIMVACEQYRQSCTSIVSNRGIRATTIAFIGPRNAGKTKTLSLLVESDERRSSLPIGDDTEGATDRVTWLAEHPPSTLRRKFELFHPCNEKDLVQLGFPYALLDVPGFNDGLLHPDRATGSRDALDYARVKVLVLDHLQIGIATWRAYVEGADGSTIIPVITKVNGSADVLLLQEQLGKCLGRSRILDPIIIPNFKDRDADEGDILKKAREDLRSRLSDVSAGGNGHVSHERELQIRQQRFREEVVDLARQHLPATATTLSPLLEELARLPEKASNLLLGDKRLLSANVRSSLRAITLERTPVFLFPWRLCLTMANLVHGATDRLPLALMGSLPSLLSTGWTAAGNLRNQQQFGTEVRDGLRRRVERELKEKIARPLENVERNLNADLRHNQAPPANMATNTSIRFIGIDALQEQSTAIFGRCIDSHGPSRLTAWAAGFLGFGGFWLILSQPLYGLYVDFYEAAQTVIAREATSLAAFPAGTFSMLATSTLLALLPMGLLLLLVLAWLTRDGKVKKCVEDIKNDHSAEITKLKNTEELRVELHEPRLDACRQLLSLAPSPASESGKPREIP